MPPITRAAFQLYLAALILGVVVGYPERADTSPLLLDRLPLGKTGMLLLFVPLLAAFVLTIYNARRGRNWARWALCALTIMSVVPYAEHVVTSFASGPAQALVPAIPALGQLVAVTLLFIGQSNAWYASQGAA